MQVNEEKLKELLEKVGVVNGDIECPDRDCTSPCSQKCVECWTEYLKEQIW